MTSAAEFEKEIRDERQGRKRLLEEREVVLFLIWNLNPFHLRNWIQLGEMYSDADPLDQRSTKMMWMRQKKKKRKKRKKKKVSI
jgi:hypothetical protein